MKKLGKLSINPEKLLRDEELVKLKGGYHACCICGNGHSIYGPLSRSECQSDCGGSGYGGGSWFC